jgi:hypothetical protein
MERSGASEHDRKTVRLSMTRWNVVEQANMTGKTVGMRMKRSLVVIGMSVDNAPKVSAENTNLNGKGI